MFLFYIKFSFLFMLEKVCIFSIFFNSGLKCDTLYDYFKFVFFSPWPIYRLSCVFFFLVTFSFDTPIYIKKNDKLVYHNNFVSLLLHRTPNIINIFIFTNRCIETKSHKKQENTTTYVLLSYFLTSPFLMLYIHSKGMIYTSPCYRELLSDTIQFLNWDLTPSNLIPDTR